MGHPLWISNPTCAEVTRLPCCGIFAASRVARDPFGLSLIFRDGLCIRTHPAPEDGFIGLSATPVIWDDGDAAAQPRYSMPPQAGNTQQPWPPRKEMSVEQAGETDLQSGVR